MNPDELPFGREIVDLSLTLAEDLPCYWATHQPFQHKTWNWFATRRDAAASAYNRSGPYATRWMALDEHTGTHFDAPSHFIPPEGSGLPHAGLAGGISAEAVPLGQLIGPAAVVPVAVPANSADKPGVSPLIGPDVITGWEREHGQLDPQDIVLFDTGWDRLYLRGEAGRRYVYDVVVTQRRAGWPAPDVATIELLLKRGVRCAGTDSPSMGAAHDGAGVHVRWLGTGAVFVECLTGLDRLPPRGAWFCFLPLKVEGGTGSPGRAVAWLPMRT